VVSAEGINSQDGTAESLQYIPVLFEVVCAEGINSAGDITLWMSLPHLVRGIVRICLSQLRPTFRVGPIEKWV
jgi:hypothetical protein